MRGRLQGRILGASYEAVQPLDDVMTVGGLGGHDLHDAVGGGHLKTRAVFVPLLKDKVNDIFKNNRAFL